MSDLFLKVRFFAYGSSFMLVFLGLGVSIILPGIDRWSKNFFKAFFTILTAYCFCVIVEEIIIVQPAFKSFIDLSYYLESLFPTLLMPMTTAYLLHSSGKDWRCSALFRAVTALWIAFFIMLNISPFTTWFYYTNPDSTIVRGPLYPLIIVSLTAIQIINVTGVILLRNKLARSYYYAFLIGTFPMAICLIVHCFVSVFELLYFAIAVSAVSMFSIILSDQARQYMLQQQEIAHQRASIMVLQMRPHFIYNTMMSIYYLCKQNSDLAQQVTLDFTTYLRKNFTAIASENLIPFSEELEHTHAYLAVEQAQFEDSLFVEYDTPHTDFLVPPLTLQPIVENAVKHGVDPDSKPLHILIRTKKSVSGSEVIVENNGPDFEPANDDEPHVALKNIRQRLEMMCHGKMNITPREGGGTVVRVTIP